MISAAKSGGKYGIKQLAKDYHKKYGVNFETFYQRIVKQYARDKAKGEDWNDGIELLVRSEKQVEEDKNYHGEETDSIAFDAALEHGNLEGIAMILKIPTTRLKRWMTQYESLNDLIHDGINKSKAMVEYNLKKLGENVTLTETKEEEGVDAKGHDFSKKVVIEKEVLGSANANIAWLKGNAPEKYGDKKDDKKASKDVINIIVGGK